jgi:hypothetical protein
VEENQFMENKAEVMVEETRRKQPDWRKIIHHGVVPLLFNLIAFCLLTYPRILDFFTHYFTNTGDGLQNVWNLWQFAGQICIPQFGLQI